MPVFLTFSAPKPLWEIPTLPALQIGSTSVSTYPIMIGMGALGMLVYTWIERKRFVLSRIQCVVFTALLTLCGIAGARLLYILENGLSSSGVSFFGSVYLIPIVMPLVGRLMGLRASRTNDLCGPCVAIMIGCIRIGCLMSGCCGGCVAYIGNYYFTWPTQIMESVGDFLIFFCLNRISRQEKHFGLLYPLFMVFYSVLRFGVEFLRYRPKGFLNISNGHWFAIIAFFAAILWIAVSKHRNATVYKAKNR